MEEEWSKWESYEVPPELGKYISRVSYPYWNKCRFFFKFRGEEHFVDFYCERKILIMELVVEKINGLIKNTGYQYYEIDLFLIASSTQYYNVNRSMNMRLEAMAGSKGILLLGLSRSTRLPRSRLTRGITSQEGLLMFSGLILRIGNVNRE